MYQTKRIIAHKSVVVLVLGIMLQSEADGSRAGCYWGT